MQPKMIHGPEGISIAFKCAGLRHKRVRPFLIRPDDLVDVPGGGKDDNWNGLEFNVGFDYLQDFIPIFLGHVEVQQDNTRPRCRLLCGVETSVQDIVQDFLPIMDEPQFVS